MSDTANFSALLQHEAFVRKTLHGLLRDDSRVDEAVQETWLRVLQRPRAALQEPRSWLAKIARHCAVSGWRSERRRQVREQQAASAGSAESAEASLSRLETRQRVVAATLALGEPYQSVVVLRYEQDLDVAAIANRLGRSAATVRSQLSRAHALLRERLDQEFGGRERWAVLATPLLGGTKSTTAGGFGPWLLLGGTATLAVAAVVWSGLGEDPMPAATERTEAASAAAAQPKGPETSLVPTSAPIALERIAASVQEPRPTHLQERLLPAGELRDRNRYDDYEAATFSFEHGLRDDPNLDVTRNDWELQFSGGQFSVDMVTDDRSAILDLGTMAPRDFGTYTVGKAPLQKEVRVVAGHAYFIGTRDSDTELATVVFVRSHEPGDTCTFDWYTTDGTGRAQGSLGDPNHGRPWIAQLAALRAWQLESSGAVLATPEVLLQLRGGARGGNLRRLDMAGGERRVRELREQPLDLTAPIDANEPCVGHCAGGLVPVGQSFVVTQIDYHGGNPGDSNGSGAFRILVGGETVVDLPPSDQPIRGQWTGRAVVASGQEAETRFEIANSSWGEVRLRGTFVAAAATLAAASARNRGFFSTEPPLPAPVGPVLGVPSARLQVRAAMVGGNSCRIDLRGRRSMQVDGIADQPLDFAMPLAKDRRVEAFARGGVLLPGTTFVVTKVVYVGSAKGDSNGHGAFRIVVAGKPIVEHRNEAAPIQGEWTGELHIVSGQESRTYLEVANSSHGDVELFGHFVRQ